VKSQSEIAAGLDVATIIGDHICNAIEEVDLAGYKAQEAQEGEVSIALLAGYRFGLSAALKIVLVVGDSLDSYLEDGNGYNVASTESLIQAIIDAEKNGEGENG
jgi:hypothetical protein